MRAAFPWRFVAISSLSLDLHPVARWISETVLVTQLEVKQGRWVIGNIGFTRHGQEHLTKLARDIIADDERLYASQQLDESDP